MMYSEQKTTQKEQETALEEQEIGLLRELLPRIDTILVLVFVIIGCKHDDPTPMLPTPPTVPSEFRGTWKISSVGVTGVTYVLTANSYTYTKENVGSYTINVLSSPTEENIYEHLKDDYPSGYTLVGKLTSRSGIFASKPGYVIGAARSSSFYLHKTDQNKMMDRGNFYEKQ